MYRPPPDPLCPICGHPEPTLLSQRDASRDDPLPSAREAEEIVYTFKCHCGVTFLHSVRLERAVESTA